MDFYLQRALQAIQHETSGMSPDQLGWHEEGKWSAAEILEHLSLTFTSTSKAMESFNVEGSASRKAPTLKQRLIRRIVVDWGYFLSGRSAPDFTRPKGLPPDRAVATICQDIAEMDEKIEACERKYGNNWLGKHPILGPFRPKHWRKFHYVHTCHHMKQIARLRELQRNRGTMKAGA